MNYPHGLLKKIVLVPLKKPNGVPTGKSTDASSDDLTFLNIDQPITSICAGQMVKNSDRSHLFVGTLSNVFGYDVENNKDLFFKEVNLTMPYRSNIIQKGSLKFRRFGLLDT